MRHECVIGLRECMERVWATAGDASRDGACVWLLNRCVWLSDARARVALGARGWLELRLRSAVRGQGAAGGRAAGRRRPPGEESAHTCCKISRIIFFGRFGIVCTISICQFSLQNRKHDRNTTRARAATATPGLRGSRSRRVANAGWRAALRNGARPGRLAVAARVKLHHASSSTTTSWRQPARDRHGT